MEAESYNLTYIWWTPDKSIITQLNYRTQITDRDHKCTYVDLSVLLRVARGVALSSTSPRPQEWLNRTMEGREIIRKPKLER